MKKAQTHRMFSKIAGRYDLLNHILSFNIDKAWRSRLVRRARADGGLVLDACAGTCDVVVEIKKRSPGTRVIGIDRSREMLEVGWKKLSSKRLAEGVMILEGDALTLPFPDDCFDAATMAFGLRNLADYGQGVREMARVVKPGGGIHILEFGPPAGGPLWAFYRWYLRRVVPLVGGIVSGERGAYKYLTLSIDGFLGEGQVLGLMAQAGLEGNRAERLSGGMVYLYSGNKPAAMEEGVTKHERRAYSQEA